MRKFPIVPARLHDSEDAPVINIMWYPTNLPFYEGESIINRRINDSDDLRDLDVGEEWQPFPPETEKREIPPGLTGNHVCHPEWFATGQPWPVTTPPTQYDAQGLPLCCGHTAPQVSLGYRPAALVSFSAPVLPSVAYGLRPAALVSYGGVVTPLVAHGLRPAALVSFSAPVLPSVAYGLRPAALVNYSDVIHPQVTYGLRPAALVSQSGHLGHTCATAPDVEDGGIYILTTSDFEPTGQLWGRLPVTPGDQIYLEQFMETPQAGQCFFGTGCDDLVPITEPVGSFECKSGIAPALGFVYMLLSADLILPSAGKWRFGFGPC